MNIKVGFVSLGCPKNLMNTERMLALLAAEGFEIVAEDVEADVMVINTCAFIESAKTEAIDSILDIAWLKEHHTLKGIVVAGCLPQRYGDEILKELPEVNCIIGTGSVEKICEAVRGASLIGKGSDILMDIDMVGQNLETGQGMCGSSSGSVPTDVGQPLIRVSKITVGGR